VLYEVKKSLSANAPNNTDIHSVCCIYIDIYRYTVYNISVGLIHFGPLYILNCLRFFLEKAEIIPGKDSDTRIKPLALTNGHGRYITVTPERALASVGGCPLNI
jgi:hypothetical protein